MWKNLFILVVICMNYEHPYTKKRIVGNNFYIIYYIFLVYGNLFFNFFLRSEKILKKCLNINKVLSIDLASDREMIRCLQNLIMF